MDLAAVRTFVAAVDTGRFQDAAVAASISQQAVSKRIATLEKALGVRLFARTARGATLTVDGHAFLPHARDLLRAEERAVASVRPGSRPLRVDVIGRRLGPAALVRDFHRAHPDARLDVVTLFDADAAVDALRSGTVDASFRAVTMPGRQLPDEIGAVRVYDEPVQLVTGQSHELAAATTVTPADLAGHRIWMPGLVPGTEWAAYYDALAAAFGLTVEVAGPDFGTAPLLETIAASRSLATLVGEHTHLRLPRGGAFDAGHGSHGLRRIALRGPQPVYPHSLIRHRANPHPLLAALHAHLSTGRFQHSADATWSPTWA